MRKSTIAVFIAVNNNASILDKCMAKMTFADEFIISDQSNNDEVRKMLELKYPTAKHFFEENIDIRKRILRAQDVIESDFLMLSSFDEFFTEASSKEIADSMINTCDYVAFRMRSREFNFGVDFGFGLYHNKIIKKGFIKYTGNNVHEFAKVEGPVKDLSNVFEHHSNPMLAINAVKMFKFEMINAQEKNLEELRKLNLENLKLSKLFWVMFVSWLRISVRYFRTLWAFRKFGYGGIAYAYSVIIRTIAEHISPTQELQFREGRVDRKDTRGYL